MTVTKTKRKPSGAAAMGAGPGRPKGIPNKVTKALKDMILGALDDAGGQEYLAARAVDPRTASAFLGLVSKVLPMQVTGPNGGAIVFERIVREIVDPSVIAA